ncbi:MAG: hypothetical protein ACRCUB_01035 [Plesiomonas shigelloides]
MHQTIKNRFLIFLIRLSGVMVISLLGTPLITGLGGVVLSIYMFFRYGIQFDFFDEFIIFAHKGIFLGVIVGVANSMILFFKKHE